VFEKFKQLFSKQVPPETWQETMSRMAKELVPVGGEAETLQGELIRSINNLADEATRNGWCNWDEGDEEAIAVLRIYLPDPDVFSQTECKEIQAALDKVYAAGSHGADHGQFGYQEIKMLARFVAHWCIKNPELIYKETGATWLDE